MLAAHESVVQNLFRTSQLSELDLGVLGFFSSLVASEFPLIEEGTSDRVLCRTAGSRIAYAHDFYNPLPCSLERVDKFERLLQPLGKIAEELEGTVEAQR